MKLIFIGLISGIISGFFGAGGGLIILPYLTEILNENEIKARATTVYCIIFIVTVSGFIYFKKGKIDFILSMKCIIGGLIGSVIGAKLLKKLNKIFLKIIFVIFLIYSGIKMV